MVCPSPGTRKPPDFALLPAKSAIGWERTGEHWYFGSGLDSHKPVPKVNKDIYIFTKISKQSRCTLCILHSPTFCQNHSSREVTTYISVQTYQWISLPTGLFLCWLGPFKERIHSLWTQSCLCKLERLHFSKKIFKRKSRTPNLCRNMTVLFDCYSLNEVGRAGRTMPCDFSWEFSLISCFGTTFGISRLDQSPDHSLLTSMVVAQVSKIPTENKLTLIWKKGVNEYLIAAAPLKKGCKPVWI